MKSYDNHVISYENHCLGNYFKCTVGFNILWNVGLNMSTTVGLDMTMNVAIGPNGSKVPNRPNRPKGPNDCEYGP